MRKILSVLFVFILATFVMAQGFGKAGSLPTNVLPFPSGSDTLINADTLSSNVLGLSNFVGAITAGLQFSKVSGTSAVVKVYYQMKNSDLNWGVPFDSIAVTNTYGGYKMIRVNDIDSTNAKSSIPIYINLTAKTWWRVHDYGRIILITGSHTGKQLVKCRIRGQ